MKVVNLTPHDIVVRTDAGDRVFPASGEVARVSTTHVPMGDVDGVPVFAQEFGDIEGLPAPQDGTIYIVSAIVLAAAKDAGRTDVVAPDTSRAFRDEAGRIVAVPGFVK